MKIPKILKNKYISYSLIVLALLNIIGYITINSTECVIIFIITGYSIYLYCKNISCAIISALFVSNFLFSCNNIKEGLWTKKSYSDLKVLFNIKKVMAEVGVSRDKAKDALKKQMGYVPSAVRILKEEKITRVIKYAGVSRDKATEELKKQMYSVPTAVRILNIARTTLGANQTRGVYSSTKEKSQRDLCNDVMKLAINTRAGKDACELLPECNFNYKKCPPRSRRQSCGECKYKKLCGEVHFEFTDNDKVQKEKCLKAYKTKKYNTPCSFIPKRDASCSTGNLKSNKLGCKDQYATFTASERKGKCY